MWFLFWFDHITAMDVSSDLIELGRTPVAVICAGVKSLLDIPRTLEYLVESDRLFIYFCMCIMIESVIIYVLGPS